MSSTRNAGTTLQTLDTIRTFCDDLTIPLQQAMTYLIVVFHGGECAQATIMKALGLAESSTSRNIDKMGTGTPKNPGLGLLESYPDPEHRSRKLVRLTDRGMALAELIAAGKRSN